MEVRLCLKCQMWHHEKSPHLSEEHLREAPAFLRYRVGNDWYFSHAEMIHQTELERKNTDKGYRTQPDRKGSK